MQSHSERSPRKFTGKWNLQEKWLTLTLCSKQDKALRVISAIKLSCDPQAINDSLFKTAKAYRVLEHQAGKNSSNFFTLVMSRGVTLGDLCYNSELFMAIEKSLWNCPSNFMKCVSYLVISSPDLIFFLGHSESNPFLPEWFHIDNHKAVLSPLTVPT